MVIEFEQIGREDVKNLSNKLYIHITDSLIEQNLSKFTQTRTVQELYHLIAQDKIKRKEFLKILYPNLKNWTFKNKSIAIGGNFAKIK